MKTDRNFFHLSKQTQPSNLLESLMISSTEYAIIATDIDNKVVLWNKGAELIYGYCFNEMIGNKLPDNLHKKVSIEKKFLYLIDNPLKSNLVDYKMSALRKDGSSLPVSVTITPRINKNNQTEGLLIMTREITKYIHQEQCRVALTEIAHLVNTNKSVDEMCFKICTAISDFLEISSVFICLFDHLNNNFYINSHSGLCTKCKTHSCSFYSKEDEVPKDTKSCFETYSQITINSENLNNHQILKYVKKNTLTEDDLSIIHIPLTSDDSLIGILHIIVSTTRKQFLLKESQVLSLIANEITAGIQRKRLVEEIKDYADNLENMVKIRTDQLREKDAQLIQSGKLATLGEMATGIAHEINQPLAGINLITQGLILAKVRNMLNDKLLFEKLNSIIEQVERINKIIGHLRTFARQSDQTKKEIDIKKPLFDVFKLIGEQLLKRKITVETNLEDNLPTILADHNKLEQVFLNLIGNARDAIEELKSVSPDEKDRKIIINGYSHKNTVVIELMDNGIGISEKVKQKIFEPFFTTKEVDKGTGIGLSITYGIVKEFGGTIEIQSKEMNGSNFIIKFPACSK
ncbi:ATP-binding protein [Herbivorax sp. ANBcel31]|uniref:PAS domain-containing sensor histidine kinase n=1 Tax=Herbivorax sp. ANBcel31 TaxID=3069754 RepID=UPI0027B3BF01|nr:ATP-binding protein [Herbivorax sp. ANBcel31]MDQ2087164.1 ATP-binding protein [Herbivorax sp. ANBcel31]